MPCRVDGSHMFQPYVMASQNTTLFFPAIRFRIQDDRMLKAYITASIKSAILHKCNRKKFVYLKDYNSTVCSLLQGPRHFSRYSKLLWAGRFGFRTPVGQDILRSPHPFRTALGPTLLHCNGYRVSFLGLKRPRRGVNQSFPSRT